MRETTNAPPGNVPPGVPAQALHHRRVRPLLPRRVYLRHLFQSVALASVVIALSLMLGAAGYHHFEHLRWIDALLNASMILTGMGPVDHPNTGGGKLFASAYALYSGIVFLSTFALVMTPIARRVIHRLHLDIHDIHGDKGD